MKTTREQAETAWREGNDAGDGYPLDEERIDVAVAALVEDGGEVVYERRNSDEIEVVRREDGTFVGFGGDAMGYGAWAVDLDAWLARAVVRYLARLDVTDDSGLDLDIYPSKGAEAAVEGWLRAAGQAGDMGVCDAIHLLGIAKAAKVYEAARSTLEEVSS